jgi:hypothetical protein
MPNINNSQSNQRLFKYSSAIAHCSAAGSVYAKCIVQNTENLKKDDCLKEFQQFKDCIKNVICI